MRDLLLTATERIPGQHPRGHPVSSPNPLSTSKTDVFLAHTWAKDSQGRDNHARVEKVNKALKEKDLTTWFDEERMVGNIRQAMIGGIDSTHCVAVFVTEVYRDKVNSFDKLDSCCFEFHYAFDMRKKLIPVVMEESMRNNRSWGGILQATVGDLLYIDMCSDLEIPFNQACDNLFRSVSTTP